MDFEDLHKEYAQYAIEMKKLIHNDLPKILGNLASSLFKSNFRDEGFFGNKWVDTKRNRYGSRRKILTGTGDLGRSINYQTGDAQVTIYSDLEYSAIHNEGGTVSPTKTAKMKKFAWAKFYEAGGTTKKAAVLSEEAQMWKAIALTKKTNLTVVIPKRQFLGDSPVLQEEIDKKINSEIEKLNKNL